MAIRNWHSMCVSVSQTARFSYPYIWRRPKPSILHDNPVHTAKLAETVLGVITEDHDKQDLSHIRTVTSVIARHR
jgi:hypothetical protein